MSMKEAVIAALTLVLLAAMAWFIGIEQWLMASLWAFISAWSVRMGISLFRTTGRRALLFAAVSLAVGAACASLLYAFWERPSAALPLAATAAVLIGGAMLVGVASWRRNLR